MVIVCYWCVQGNFNKNYVGAFNIWGKLSILSFTIYQIRNVITSNGIKQNY